MNVEFSETALAGIRREIPDESRQKSCVVSLTFYLRRDFADRAELCPAFTDRDLYIYAFQKWRVLFEARGTRIIVWSFILGRQ